MANSTSSQDIGGTEVRVCCDLHAPLLRPDSAAKHAGALVRCWPGARNLGNPTCARNALNAAVTSSGGFDPGPAMACASSHVSSAAPASKATAVVGGVTILEVAAVELKPATQRREHVQKACIAI